MARLLLAGLVYVLISAGMVDGALVEYSNSVDLANTNWGRNLAFPKFDPSLGPLDSITITVEAQVGGVAAFENMESTPVTVTMAQAAGIWLKRPDLSDICIATPTAIVTEDVGAYDGWFNYGGGSGRFYPNLSESQSLSVTTNTVADLALFSGAGDIYLPIIAIGYTQGTGASNLICYFETQAAADVTVSYTYLPELSTVAFLSAGMLFFASKRKSH
jgi:hypothetical protein